MLSGFTLSVWPALQAMISGLSMDTHKDSEDANLFAGPLSADVWAYGMTVMVRVFFTSLLFSSTIEQRT